MDRKAHDFGLDKDLVRERMAHDTFGYTPVMIEHLFDEALLVALRAGRQAMYESDVYEAKLTEEVGLKQPVSYTDGERMHTGRYMFRVQQADTAEVYDEFTAKIIAIYRSVPPIAGAEDAIRQLRQSGYLVATTTGFDRVIAGGDGT